MNVAAHFLVALALPAAAGASEGSWGPGKSFGAGPTAPSAQVAIKLAISIPRVLRMTLLLHPASVLVTEHDIAKGKIVVRGPRIGLLANNREGYVVRVELRGAAFTGLRLAGLAREVNSEAGGSVTPMPFTVGAPRTEPAEVEYHLRLARDVSPGPYAWPVCLTVQDP